MFRFHSNCGARVKFSEDCRTAERTLAKTDFNNGLAFSETVLGTNSIFQVRIDKKVGLWSGSIEVGVTTVCPDTFTQPTVPQSAIELRNGTWLMSSHSVLVDGEILIENYGFDLEKLEEGDTVGLMRTIQGGLVFFVNGTSQGVASTFIPPEIYAIVNLYGKCAQVSLVDVAVSEQSTNTVELVVHEETPIPFSSSENNNECEKLKFHSNCGPLVKLSSHNRTAERRRPMEEFNNAVVLTNRPLADDELFQIRIDLLVHKWSGSIEFGLTSHNPETFDFPATMTIMRNGTVIMSGTGILHDGKATNSPYACFNLDQLQEGDRIGVMKNAAGDVHYLVNGIDQGVATSGINHQVWGAINLYGMAAKVTMVDRNEREEHNLRLNVRSLDYITENVTAAESDLLFHPNCGFHAAVINNGRTAHRPNARDDFNHGVVLTNRILKPNEFFEVRLDKMVTKWAGSIEIGVTTHVPTQLDYPCTMTNVRSGTWMMTGSGIMHNGASVVDEYGQSLDRLKVGDRVGVLRKENGNLHFFVNGEDQGCAATNIPDGVFGVIDLYGQAAQATVILHSNENNETNTTATNEMAHDNSTMSSVNNGVTYFGTGSNLGDSYFDCQSGDVRFNVLCGKNARISNNGLTASRPNALGEFNAAIVTSSRALRDGELFEVVIERMVDRWSGNIEAGVTTIRPEELVFPNTMTDIDHDTWMLSGSSIMSCGKTITTSYNCNLDTLTIGSRVGMMRKSDGTLHYFVNGEDQGIGAYDIPQEVYAVIDLYGECAAVSVTRLGDVSVISSQVVDSLSQPFLINDASHRFSICCGKNIILKNNNLTATRVRQYAHGLLFSSLPLESEEIFEVRLTEIRNKWAGCIMIGLTTLCITDDYPATHITHTISTIRAKTWYIAENQVRRNNVVLKENYGVNLNRLSVGDRLGISISPDRTLNIFLNGEDMGVAASNLPKKLHVVVDLYGSTETVTITSTATKNGGIANSEGGLHSSYSPNEDLNCLKAISINVPSNPADSSLSTITFDGKHFGRNIELSNGSTVAKRTSGYNQGIVLVTQQMQPGFLFQVRIDTLNLKWSSSIMVGVVDNSFDRTNLPWSAFQMGKSCCVICGDCVYQNGVKVKSNYGLNLDFLAEGHIVGLLIDFDSNLHMYVNGVDQGIAAKIGSKCRVLVDLYGQCEAVTILSGEDISQETRDLKSINPAQSMDKLSKLFEDHLVVTNCEYMSACICFKNSLCLPDPYFVSSEPVLCYCTECYRIRGDPIIYKQGDPPVEYALPLGWVRFPLNISLDSFPPVTTSSSQSQMMTSSTSSLSNVLTTWHVAYHGLKIPHVREVMDAGQLFAAGDPEFGTFGNGYTPSKIPKGNKDEKSDGPLLTFSPSVEYAAIPIFSPVYPYVEPKKKQKLSIRVALQLLVQPGSYKVGAASHPNPITTPSLRQDPLAHLTASSLDPDTLEWASKEQGSTHVCALLVRLNGLNLNK